MRTKQQINDHKITANLLNKIMLDSFEFIRNNKKCTEYDVQQFILKEFEKNNLVTDEYPPIVAFGKNSSNIHYFPQKESQCISENTIVMIDIRAKLNKSNSPYADITRMAYTENKVPQKIIDVWNSVKHIRDSVSNYINSSLSEGIIPTGNELQKQTELILEQKGYTGKMNHSLGHSLGIDSPHGKHNCFNYKNVDNLKINLGYTNEPGIYIPNDFGIRSEINYYINEKLELVITSGVQEEIFKIQLI